MQLDLVIRGGSVVNADGAVTADVGISGERIVAIGAGLGPGKREIDARGKLVMPGGVDSHCHIEQVSSFGIMCADDFHSATVSAAFGAQPPSFRSAPSTATTISLRCWPTTIVALLKKQSSITAFI